MNRNLSLAIVLSVALHLGVLSCAPQQKKEEQKQGQKEHQAETISAVTKPPEVRIIEEKTKGLKGRPAFVSDCKSQKYYTGIGIFSRFDIVVEVAKGGPADKAGIKQGDTIMNRYDIGADKHPVGTKVVLNINRDGDRFDTQVTIDKVCYADRENP